MISISRKSSPIERETTKHINSSGRKSRIDEINRETLGTRNNRELQQVKGKQNGYLSKTILTNIQTLIYLHVSQATKIALWKINQE